MWEKLKTIIKTMGGKAIIVEDGEPQYVVLSVDEYLKLQEQAPTVPTQSQYSYTQSPEARNESNALGDFAYSPGTMSPPGNTEGILTQAHASPRPFLDLSDIEVQDEPISERSSEISLDDLPL